MGTVISEDMILGNKNFWRCGSRGIGTPDSLKTRQPCGFDSHLRHHFMCGKLIDIKVRIVKEVPGLSFGKIYEPYWYRTHDMNRAPISKAIIYLKNDNGEEMASEISNFEEVK